MADMRAFRIAYDGRPYHGFQRQPDLPTVEDEILAALEALDILDTREASDTPPGYAAAGRTDAGVSAVAQTVAFEAPDWLRPAALDSELPASVHAWASADAPADFHATHHAVSRSYTYVLYAPDAEVTRVRQALATLSGDHDFHNLTPDERGTRRELAVTVRRDGPMLVLRVRAGGFPRQLVRRLVSLVDEIARGDAGQKRIERVLSPEPLAGPDGIAPAPAYPLVLTDVEYPELDFEVDTGVVATTSERFESQRVEHVTRARVAGLIAEQIGDEKRDGSDQ